MKTGKAPSFALPKTIQLHMDQGDIQHAVCRSRSQCAIARNIYRELDIEVGRVRVATSGISIAKDGYRYYYKVPNRACKLVATFDAGETVEPIVYRLRRTHRQKIAAVDEERRKQVNLARQERVATLAAVGRKPKQYKKGRYGI